MAKQTIFLGTTSNDGTGTTLRAGGDMINDNFDEVYSFTGWEQITDTTYTVGSPLSILEGVTGKILTGTVTKIQTQLPAGVTTFWDATTDKLLAVNNGDAFTLSLRFKAKMNVLSYFTGTTFIANGGILEIVPTNGNISIYDIVMVLIRTHKGK